MNVFERMQAMEYPQVEQQITPRDAMLYALGIGIGGDPLDPAQLRYVYEKDLRVFPTMAITLCYPGSDPRSEFRTGLDQGKVLHAFQGFELLAPIPLDRTLVGRNRITGVFDKGAGRGVLWTYEERIHDQASGQLICVLNGASMSLVGGGVGGPRGESYVKREFPARAPDAVRETKTLPQAGLIYRLSGDYNPLHADPDMAKQAGFDQPILHGRCTFGIAGRAVVDAFCDHDGQRLTRMEARFTAPVYSGELIRTELWKLEREGVLFRSSVPARKLTVLDQGYAKVC